MIAIIDARSPKIAIDNLANFCSDILLFESKNITGNSISGHLDIFIFKDEKYTVVAPNTPPQVFDFLNKHKIDFSIGETQIGESLNASAPYNCVTSSDYLFHKKDFTDSVICKLYNDKTFINLPQSFAACSIIKFDDNYFVTSDKGIKNVMDKNNIVCEYFSPERISIFGHKYGFLGGTAGITDSKIFFNGNIQKHEHAKVILDAAEKFQFEIISLHQNFLYDGGRILFWNKT